MADLGNLSSNTADFLPQFKAIGQSLKKRFFRKPNVAEAIEQYESLCQELQREEQKAFAAICCLEASKCQESLRDFVQQANLLLKAGKLFLAARESERHFEDPFTNSLASPSLSGNLLVLIPHSPVPRRSSPKLASAELTVRELNVSNLDLEIGMGPLGVQCLSQAAKVYKNVNLTALSCIVTLQAGEALYNEGHYGEAFKHYKTVFDITKTQFNLLDHLVVVDLVTKSKVKMMEYESVLKTVNEVVILIGNAADEGYPKETLDSLKQKYEIMRVILILILGEKSVDMLKFIWPESSKTSLEDDRKFGESCEEYGNTNVPESRRKVLFHLRSLVLAVEHGSAKEINAVRNGLAHVFTETHHDLLYTLIQMQS